LPDLKSLTIMIAPGLTAVGLKKLGPVLSQLELLNLYQTGMTDEGMDCFDACRKLKTLSLGIPNVGDAGFMHFRNLESLEKLIISGSNVTDEGLSALRGLKNLKVLSLAGTRIAGPGLASLEHLDQLETLTLVESKLTDEGLDSIRKMKGLKLATIGGTHVTPEAIARLQAERPTLKINPAPIPPVRKPPIPTAPAAKK
jgi:internalin A